MSDNCRLVAFADRSLPNVTAAACGPAFVQPPVPLPAGVGGPAGLGSRRHEFIGPPALKKAGRQHTRFDGEYAVVVV